MQYIGAQMLNDDMGSVFNCINDIVVYDDDHDYSSPDAVGSVSRLWAKNGSTTLQSPSGLVGMREA